MDKVVISEKTMAAHNKLDKLINKAQGLLKQADSIYDSIKLKSVPEGKDQAEDSDTSSVHYKLDTLAGLLQSIGYMLNCIEEDLGYHNIEGSEEAIDNVKSKSSGRVFSAQYKRTKNT